MKQNIIRDKCNQNKESDENRIDLCRTELC